MASIVSGGFRNKLTSREDSSFWDMQILVHYLQRLPKQSCAVLQTCLYDLGAGASAVFFQLGINWLYRLGLAGLSHQSTSTFLIGSLAIVVVSSLLMGWLLNSFCREAVGSSIPQLKLAFWKDFGTVPWRVAWVKFVAGIVGIGGGQSLGREGPSVQLAGAVSSNLAGLAGEAKLNRRLAAAGLAAAFNTTLTPRRYTGKTSLRAVSKAVQRPERVISPMGQSGCWWVTTGRWPTSLAANRLRMVNKSSSG